METPEKRRLYAQWWLERAPRPLDLTAHPMHYAAGNRLHSQLWLGGFTMLGARRARTLYRCAVSVRGSRIPGALVDCGVWNGGSTALLSAGAPERDVWAFDSFRGLPEPGELDGDESRAFAGDCVGSVEKVVQAVERYGTRERLHIREGWFEDTFPEAAPAIDQIAVLHVDGDWYESVRLTLETFYPKVVPGGFVIIDDYGTWPGAMRATDEYRGRVGDRTRLIRVDHTGRYWRKAGA
jgi:O-methyltransferase